MFRLVFIISMLMFLVACGSSPKTHFYILDANQASSGSTTGKAGDAPGVKVGLWAVELPPILDRPEIVSRTGQYNIELADFHQWSGGLGNNISRLIRSELERGLQTDYVLISPWSSYRKNDYQVKVFITRFDGMLGGEIYFSGTWSLLNGEGNKELVRDSFTLKTQAKGKTYNDMVAALSELTVQLSDVITKVVATQQK